MRQFILPDDFSGQEKFELSGETFHYLCRVIRKKEGDSFPGLDKSGSTWNIRIEQIGGESCLISLERGEDRKKEETEFTLVQCLPKGKKMDLIIRQAIEAGVSRIIPVMSDHAIPRFDNERDMEKKRERWEKIAVEAMQQSGSSIMPRIDKPVRIDDITKMLGKSGTGFFCHQKRIDDNSLHQYLNETPGQVFIVIGPEGGISDREVSLLGSSGFHPIYLGGNVLRTETAALFATAAIKVILLERNRWSLKQ